MLIFFQAVDIVLLSDVVSILRNHYAGVGAEDFCELRFASHTACIASSPTAADDNLPFPPPAEADQLVAPLPVEADQGTPIDNVANDNE